MPLDVTTAAGHAATTWADEIVPSLHDYIAIPALSPMFDRDWAAHGHLAAAVELVRGWCSARPIPGLTVEVHELEGRSPVIVMEVPATGGGDPDDTVLLYGHLDKQPEMTGWRDGLGPWLPVREGDRLYGRGGADDGYAAFASLGAIEAVHAAGGAHARCIVLIEASEESGSPDLPAHIEALADRLGTPSLVVCLDSGCLDYQRLWVTTSLRGLAGGKLKVEILGNGVHSGDASGVVPDTFRIVRHLLDRVEDAASGEVLLADLHVAIPDDRRREAAATAADLAAVSTKFPWVDGARPAVDDPTEQLLARTWRPALTVTGADGLPATAVAGNVLRPSTTLQLSMRLPPSCDPDGATELLRTTLTTDPPHGARVSFAPDTPGPGWNAPAFSPWLWDSLERASQASFGSPARTYGEGGSIPFMGMLGERFPEAQFVITGVLGPDSNAHGPDEYLHLPTAERLTVCLAAVLDDHAHR